jgi:hypothetical protein
VPVTQGKPTRIYIPQSRLICSYISASASPWRTEIIQHSNFIDIYSITYAIANHITTPMTIMLSRRRSHHQYSTRGCLQKKVCVCGFSACDGSAYERPVCARPACKTPLKPSPNLRTSTLKSEYFEDAVHAGKVVLEVKPEQENVPEEKRRHCSIPTSEADCKSPPSQVSTRGTIWTVTMDRLQQHRCCDGCE